MPHTDHSRKKTTSCCTSTHHQLTHQASSNKSQHPSVEDDSSNEDIFNTAKPEYEAALQNIGYSTPLSFLPHKPKAKEKGTSVGSVHPTTKASKPTLTELSLT